MLKEYTEIQSISVYHARFRDQLALVSSCTQEKLQLGNLNPGQIRQNAEREQNSFQNSGKFFPAGRTPAQVVKCTFLE